MAAPFPIVGIGASAGGLEALQQFFTHMPAEGDMAFVIVQHLDPTHKSIMSDLLQKYTPMPVAQVEDGMHVQLNHIYLIPPNTTLTLQESTLRLAPPEAPRGYRVPIDLFLRSLAHDQKDNAIGIILSGTGSDGTLGLKLIKEQGGMTMVQSDAKYMGMPHNALETGLVDYVLSAAEMPEKLLEYVRNRSRLAQTDNNPTIEEDVTSHLGEIFLLLRRHTGHDFSLYKHNTIIRRIQRRMQVLAFANMPSYIAHLRDHPAEIEALFKELLIGVTHFFRDPEAFDLFEHQILPELMASKTSGDALRVWVPGCATGEEAYSIAMLLHEHAARSRTQLKLQIFATDIDPRALETARLGVYSESISVDVSPDRLNHYFSHQEHRYVIDKQLRETCIFSEHNLIKDPPFSRLDLISCRNLLIYLTSELQQKLMPLFHYAIRPGGMLWLGPSESIMSSSDLFATVDKKYKFFRRNDAASKPAAGFPWHIPKAADPDQASPLAALSPNDANLSKIADRLVLDDHAPPYVLINVDLNVIYASSRTGTYLELPRGEPNVNILNMARPALRLELRSTIHRALRDWQLTTHDHVVVEVNGSPQHLRIVVRPIVASETNTGPLLVLFQEIGNPETVVDNADITRHADAHAPVIQQLENELKTTKENLQTAIEELETSNEELKSSNEELMSMNEELQSTNEELETSKEELQSINEELTTVNSELQHKIEELDRANNDIKNLLDNTHIATLFLDAQGRIQNFTPAMTHICHVIHSDIGRPIVDITMRFQHDRLQHDIDTVLRELTPVERQIQTQDEHWYMMRILPYRTTDQVIDGVVLTFVDVTQIKEAEAEIQRLNQILRNRIEELEALLELIPNGIAICEDDECQTVRFNRMGCELLGLAPGTSMTLEELGGEALPYRIYQNDLVLAPEQLPLCRAANLGDTVEDEEITIRCGDGRTLQLYVSAHPLRDDQGQVRGAVAAFVDMTSRNQMLAALQTYARQQATVVQLGMQALGRTDVTAIIDEAVVTVAATLNVPYSVVFKYYPADQSLLLEHVVGWQAGHLGQVTLPTAEGSHPGYTLLQDTPIAFEDLSQEARFRPTEMLRAHHVLSGIGVPIYASGDHYGVLAGYTTERRTFSHDDQLFLQAIAHVITMALHRQRIEVDLRREQLQHAERLASLGTLAAGIAHEINNPLNTIALYAEEALSLHSHADSTNEINVATSLQDILQEVERCRVTIRNLQRFCPRGDYRQTARTAQRRHPPLSSTRRLLSPGVSPDDCQRARRIPAARAAQSNRNRTGVGQFGTKCPGSYRARCPSAAAYDIYRWGRTITGARQWAGYLSGASPLYF